MTGMGAERLAVLLKLAPERAGPEVYVTT